RLTWLRFVWSEVIMPPSWKIPIVAPGRIANFRVRTFFLIVRTGRRDSLYTGWRLTHNAFTSPHCRDHA
ncbi:MAG: hypothetical protein E7K05_17890, partial [Serratia marcescens]|nr:hypothetical protein [Serratia marcescens]